MASLDPLSTVSSGRAPCYVSDMSNSTDVIVVGAGAIGASVAYHLSLAGARVTVLEKEPRPA